ncbi:MAG: hypothetical protein JXB10_03490 [Pirellulales bacterium]|nr:hypothetical protein [Pirellulales bacterium]
MEFVYPPARWQAKLPQVRALQEEIYRISDTDALKAGRISLIEVERVLAKARPALEKLDQAQKKKQCVFITGLGMDTLLLHAQAAREFARLGVIQLFHANARDDFPEAEQAINRTLRFVRDLRPRGCAVCQLVSVSMERMVLLGIADFTLTQPGLTPKDCDRLLALLAEHQQASRPFALEGLRMEYIACRNLLEDLRTGRLRKEQFVEDFNNFSEGRLSLQVEQLRDINYQTEILALKRASLTLASMINQPYYQLTPDQFEKVEIPKLRAEGALITATFLVSPDPGLLRTQARLKAEFAGMQSLIAARRYMLVHGKAPLQLAEAVKEAGMKEVPLDPFNGRALCYGVEQVTGNPVVYSVGYDRVDNRAQMDCPGFDQPGDIICKMGEKR